ncbi:V-set and transmembrane domain-containing protein 4a [Esox lucius]|uniref:Ig-like domain-containing protein n=1 Tax=Esox lucius TaxID=8010 RepID=A0A3P8XYD5_ESOLU|nr:V-set and transmembrane domain-containing protein 4a [Esox lucius]
MWKMNSFVPVILLIRALISGVCDALNVTVTPGPVVKVTEGENLTLSCLVSQKKRSANFLVLRWLFSPPPLSYPPPPLPPSPSPPPPPEQLIVKLTMKKIKVYGNYTRRFPQPKFHLYEEREGRVGGELGEAYGLLVLNVTRRDCGFYTCRVQEIRRHRNSWKASSNGTATAQLTVPFPLLDSSDQGLWRLFGDVYLCAVLLCSLGLLSIFLFSLVLTCQYLRTRHTLKKASYYLVKCPESSSGETVTSSVSSSSSSPGAHRKEKRTRRTQPRESVDIPPYIPDKVPVAAERQRPRKPRRLKSQPRRPVTSRVCEDNLTYAELEMVRPRLEPSSSSPTSPSSPSIPELLASSPSCSDTVYAQILFQE